MTFESPQVGSIAAPSPSTTQDVSKPLYVVNNHLRSSSGDPFEHNGVTYTPYLCLHRSQIDAVNSMALEFEVAPGTYREVTTFELQRTLTDALNVDDFDEHDVWGYEFTNVIIDGVITPECLTIIKLMLDRHWAANPDQAPTTAPQSAVKTEPEWSAKDTGFGHESEPEVLLQIQGTTISSIIKSAVTTEERECGVSFWYQNGRGDYMLVHEKSLMPHLGYGPDSEDNWYVWVDAMWAILRNNTPSEEALELIETVLIGYWTANPDKAPAFAHQINDAEVTLVSATRSELSSSSYEHKYLCDYNGGKYIFAFTVVRHGGEDDAVATSLKITHSTGDGAFVTYGDADLLASSDKVDMDNYEWCELYSLLGEKLDIKSIRTFAAATIPALRQQPPLSA